MWFGPIAVYGSSKALFHQENICIFPISPRKVMLWVLIRSASTVFLIVQLPLSKIKRLSQSTNSDFLEFWDNKSRLYSLLHVLLLSKTTVLSNQTSGPFKSEITRVTCIYKLIDLITKTRLYNFDSLKPHFYIAKLGQTGVYIIFLISTQKHRLWVFVRTASARRF